MHSAHMGPAPGEEALPGAPPNMDSDPGSSTIYNAGALASGDDVQTAKFPADDNAPRWDHREVWYIV